MISPATSHVIQQYQQIAAPLAPGHTTAMQEDAGLPVQPVQAPDENVSVSEEARKLSQNHRQPGSKEEAPDDRSEEQPSSSSHPQELNKNDQATIVKLSARDREVRAHEQAHIAAGGQYIRSSANFTYQRGPDGKIYAVGGEVSIDVGKGRTPEETLAKMQTVRRAALAPANPSSTDRQVAAQATARMNQARQEIQQGRMEELVAKIDNEEDADKVLPEDSSSGKQTRHGISGSAQLAEDYTPINEYI